MSPSTFFSAALPPGLETAQRIYHPPACFTAWTTLNIIYYPYLFYLCLSLSVYLSIYHFFLTFFYILFCSSVTPFMPLSLFFHFLHPCCSCTVALVVISHICYVQPISMALRNSTLCVSLCSSSHSLCPLSELYSLDLFTDAPTCACMCSSYQNDPIQTYKSWLHTYNDHVYLILHSLFSTDFDVTNDYCSQG